MLTQPSKTSGTGLHTRAGYAHAPSSSVYSAESGYGYQGILNDFTSSVLGVSRSELDLTPENHCQGHSRFPLANMPHHYAILPIRNYLAVPGNPDIHPALRQDDCIARLPPSLQVNKVETVNVERPKVRFQVSEKNESNDPTTAGFQDYNSNNMGNEHDTRFSKRNEKEKTSKSKSTKGKDKSDPNRQHKDHQHRQRRDPDPAEPRHADEGLVSNSLTTHHSASSKPFPMHVLLRRITTAQIPITAKITFLINLHNTLIELSGCTTSELELARCIDATARAAETQRVG